MLYNEFLNGTNAPDNPHTYAEYKRIEKIYNADNRMEKIDAYKMYQKPDELTKTLLTEISRLKDERYQLESKLNKIKKENEELRKVQSSYKSLQEEAEELKKMFTHFTNDFYYHMEDKMGIF